MGELFRRVLGAVGLAAWLAACGPLAVLTRPEGNGGWDAKQRATDLAERAQRAGVSLDPAASTPDAGEEPLTLGRALTLAAHDNRAIQDADAQVDAAAARVRDARGRLLPSLVGSGRYSWYTAPQTTGVALPQSVITSLGGTPQVTVREAQFGVLNAALAVPVDVTGELYHQLAAAQASYRSERARSWAATLLQELEVIRTYYRLLESRRLAEVTRKTLALQRAQLTNAESRFTAGRLTKNEVLVVQVAVRNSEQALLQRELEVAAACWALNGVVGRPVDSHCTLVDVTSPPALPDTETALRTAYADNPALLALVEEQQRLEDAETAIARGWLPRFGAGLTADWSSAEIFQPQTVGAAFVGVTVDLGIDGRRAAQLADARIQVSRARLATERQLRDLEAAVRLAHRAAEERLAALATAAAAVAQAEENLRIRDRQFEVGRAESTDVLDAQALFAVQKAAEATALYEAHTRRAELQQLMGLPLDALAEEASR